MAPHGNGPPINSNETNQKFYVFSENDSSVKNIIEAINKGRILCRRDKFCVVSIIGKSDFDSKNCKAALIDEVIGKNVFRGVFCQTPQTNKETIEGYCDSRNNVIYLHLSSIFDTHVLQQACKTVEKELVEKGFLQVWPDMQINLAKALLLLFHISHIVIIVHPTLQFDLNYINLFHVLDSTRQKLQPAICEMLQKFDSLPSDWVSAGRLCSPRALFLFESYNDDKQIDQKKITEYKQQLEEQIYRILRKSRVITNISGNSLFALPLHSEFVFISTKDSAIRNPNEYLLSKLIKFCNPENNADKYLKKNDQANSFGSFLQNHVQLALTKGFDDNIGRHAAPPIFELPSYKDFFQVLLKLKEIIFQNDTNETKTAFTNLRAAFDIDTRFSETRCAKVLPIALSHYKDQLPSHYTREFHEIKVAQAVQQFTHLARGPAIYDYAQQLKSECNNYWQNGHQMCETLSLTGNHCIQPVHLVKQNDDDISDDESESNGLPQLKHHSGYKLISACDCGRKQGTREDPFTVKAANCDFYAMMKNKCVCGRLESISFPIFEPSTDDIHPAMTFPINKSQSSGKGIQFSNEASNEISSDEIHFESQPDVASSFTNLSQQITSDMNTDLLANDSSKLNVGKDDVISNNENSEQKTSTQSGSNNDKKGSDEDFDDEIDSEDSNYSDEEDEQSNNSIGLNERRENMRLIIRETISPFGGILQHQTSTTQYLPRMLHTMSPPGLLPKYSSWSLICVGPSSIYSHNIGLQDQQGFIAGSNFLLPWDVTVKLEHSGHLPPLWEGKRPPGIKNKKTFKDGTQFTVKIFIGVEYECPRGRRFICSGPDNMLKTNIGTQESKNKNQRIKESANRVATNDMPLYFPCVCSRTGKLCLAQLMRIHIVTPKAPVYVTLNPRVQPAPLPCPIFYPGNSEPIKLSQSTYWILRLPLIYEGDHGPYLPPKDQLPIESSRLLKGTYGIADYIAKPKSND